MMEAFKNWLRTAPTADKLSMALLGQAIVMWLLLANYKPLPWGLASAAWLAFVGAWVSRLHLRGFK